MGLDVVGGAAQSVGGAKVTESRRSPRDDESRSRSYAYRHTHSPVTVDNPHSETPPGSMKTHSTGHSLTQSPMADSPSRFQMKSSRAARLPIQRGYSPSNLPLHQFTRSGSYLPYGVAQRR